MNTVFTASCALLFYCAVPLGAAPLLIDDFSTSLAPTTSNSFVDGSMLGGELDISLGFLDSATVEIDSGNLTLSGVTETGGANNAQFVYDGDDDTITFAYGLPDVDFTDSGSNDRFIINLTSVTGTIDVLVQVRDDNSNFSFLTISNISSPGMLEFPFTDFYDSGAGADFAAAKQVAFWVYLDTGDGFAIDSFSATADPSPPLDPPVATPDTTPPTIKFLKKKKLKSPRPRHTIKGTVPADVIRVELKSSLQKGWRRATLKSPEKWKFRTPRLKPGRNRVKIRAIDSTGNVSRITRIKVTGVSDLDPGSGR